MKQTDEEIRKEGLEVYAAKFGRTAKQELLERDAAHQKAQQRLYQSVPFWHPGKFLGRLQGAYLGGNPLTEIEPFEKRLQNLEKQLGGVSQKSEQTKSTIPPQVNVTVPGLDGLQRFLELERYISLRKKKKGDLLNSTLNL